MLDKTKPWRMRLKRRPGVGGSHIKVSSRAVNRYRKRDALVDDDIKATRRDYQKADEQVAGFNITALHKANARRGKQLSPFDFRGSFNPFAFDPRALHPPQATPSKNSGMAMDDLLGDNNSSLSTSTGMVGWGGAALSGIAAEGMTFMGYAYLSELAQRPEYRKISETIATEMTRKWIKIISTSDKPDKNKTSQEDGEEEDFDGGEGETEQEFKDEPALQDVEAGDDPDEGEKPARAFAKDIAYDFQTAKATLAQGYQELDGSDDDQREEGKEPDSEELISEADQGGEADVGPEDDDQSELADQLEGEQDPGEIEEAGQDDKTDKIKAIEKEMRRLKMRDVFRRWIELDGFFGRSHLYIDTGDTDNPEELKMPIGNGRDDVSQRKVGKGKLQALRAVEPVWCYPTRYNSNDPLKEDWYRPNEWYVMGKQLDKTRLLTMIGREVPDMLKPAYSFGGLSLTQMAKPYVENWLRTRQSISDLIHSFSVSGLLTVLEESLKAAGDRLFERVELFNLYRDNSGMMVLDKETEEFFNVATPLSTLDKLQAQAQEQMCSISNIPLVKFTGISPTGLNASSEGEVRVFYDFINSMQEKLLTEPIECVLGFIQLNLFGAIDPDISFLFEPLWAMDDVEKSQVRSQDMSTDVEAINAGVLHPEESRKRIANDPDSPYPNLDVEDVPDDPREQEMEMQQEMMGQQQEEGDFEGMMPPGSSPGGPGASMGGKKPFGGGPGASPAKKGAGGPPKKPSAKMGGEAKGRDEAFKAKRTKYFMAGDEFREEQHPRGGKGTQEGGRFVKGAGHAVEGEQEKKPGLIDRSAEGRQKMLGETWKGTQLKGTPDERRALAAAQSHLGEGETDTHKVIAGKLREHDQILRNSEPNQATKLFDEFMADDKIDMDYAMRKATMLINAQPGLTAKINAIEAKIKAGTATDKLHKDENGQYTPERKKLHEKIIRDMLTPEKIKAATPPPGIKPTVTFLGGRGGSGKSWLTRPEGPVDAEHAITLNSDDVQEHFPEYEGWNAAHTHDEAAEIVSMVEHICRGAKLNVILDATMRTEASARSKVEAFKKDGYDIEGHYMFAPPELAASRAIGRFVRGGEKGRYVPPQYTLGSLTNEKTFDALTPEFKKWSIHKNTGSAPEHVASGAMEDAKAK